MIDKIEKNDLGFTAIWSKMTKLECGVLFMNSDFPDDLFFDKLTNITCLNKKMIDDVVEIFHQNKMRPFVYSLNNMKLEDLLKKMNFTLYDTQHVLVNTVQQEIADSQILHITKNDSLVWSEIFCKSYDCTEWLDEVNNIVKKSTSKIDYLVDAKHKASCVALYETDSVLGLYCLGTIPQKRKNGLAKLLINYAQSLVKKRNLEFLMLETYQKDALLEFYTKLGFNKVYEKKIFTI